MLRSCIYWGQEAEGVGMAWIGWLVAVAAVAVAAFLFVRLRDARASNAQLNDEVAEAIAENDLLQATRARLVPISELGAIGQLALGAANEVDAPLSDACANAPAIVDRLDEYRRLVKAYDAAVQYCLQPVEMIFGADKAGLDQLVKHVEEARRRLFIARSNLEKSAGLGEARSLLIDAAIGLQRSSKFVRGLASLEHRDAAGERGPVDLHATIDGVLAVLAPAWQGRIEIIREHGELPVLNGASAQIARIFLHIANNAGQAIQGNGKLVVKTRPVGGRNVEISFSDNGEGVTDDVLAQMFEPFFTTRSNAPGMGLAAAREIAVKCGGSVTARHADSGGTTVLVTLPVEAPAR